jgi:hypothetical protein
MTPQHVKETLERGAEMIPDVLLFEAIFLPLAADLPEECGTRELAKLWYDYHKETNPDETK